MQVPSDGVVSNGCVLVAALGSVTLSCGRVAGQTPGMIVCRARTITRRALVAREGRLRYFIFVCSAVKVVSEKQNLGFGRLPRRGIYWLNDLGAGRCCVSRGGRRGALPPIRVKRVAVNTVRHSVPIGIRVIRIRPIGNLSEIGNSITIRVDGSGSLEIGSDRCRG